MVIAVAVYAINASWLAPTPSEKPLLLAHRGVFQRFDHTALDRDSCTAMHMQKPTNRLLENTLPSMRAAFDAGADTVELDVHPTTDGQFAVFHDWTLDCRTDGHGPTRAHSLAELKKLDIGYGYTNDRGRTFPFRGAFRGAMPSLAEAADRFPDAHFLINIKSNDASEADRLDAYLRAHPEMNVARLSVYGGGEQAMRRLAELRPALRPFSIASLKGCAYGYLALGWSGYMPKACRHTTLLLPLNWTWMMWGYPNRLQARFKVADSYIYLLGQHGRGETGPRGVDTPAQLAKVPPHWAMGLWTDAVETMAPLLRARELARQVRGNGRLRPL
jgi:glycerophosphoryl diester phosphodiesterase